MKNETEFKGGYDIVLYNVSLDGTINSIVQNSEWNTSGTSRLSHQPLAIDTQYVYFTYWTNQSISGNTQTGTYDIVVCKSTLTGEIEWIKQDEFPNATGTNTWSAITLDNSGHPCIAFTTTGTIDKDPSGERVGRDIDTNLILCKLNKDTGNVEWARQRAEFNSTKGSVSRPSISCDDANNIFVGYGCTGAVKDRIKTTLTSTDVVLFKMDTDGSIDWLKQNDELNTPYTNTAPIIRVNSTNDVVVAYSTSGLVEEKNKFYYTNHTGHTDLVVVRINGTTSNIQWLRQRRNLNSVSIDTPYSIQCDSNNTVYISYTVSILNLYELKILREDAVIVRLSPYGDMESLKYDSELNYQENNYRHIAPKLILLNQENTLFTAYGFSQFTEDTIYNQQYKEIRFETNNDIVLKRFDIESTDTEFLIWTKQDLSMNTSKKDLSPNVAVDGSNDIVVIYRTDGALSGYTLKGKYDVVLFKTYSSGTMQWAKQTSGWNTTGKATLSKKCMVVDTDNNIVFTYSSRKSALTNHSMTGTEDIILVKLDSSGEIVWTHQDILPNTTKYNSQPCLALDSSNDIIVSFITNGQVASSYAGTASDTHTPTKTGRNVDMNVVVFKFDTLTENVVWTRQEPLLNSPEGSMSKVDIVLTTENHIVLSYASSGALPDMSKNTTTSTDVILAKLDTDGEILWRKQDTDLNTTLTNTTPYIVMNEENDIILTHSTSGTLSGSSNTHQGDTDLVVSRLDGLDGSKLWTHQFDYWNTSRQETPYSILTDNSQNIFISYTMYQATLDNRPSEREDATLLKLDKNGQLIFAQQDDTLNHRLKDYRHTSPKIALDNSGNLLMTYGFTRFQFDDTNLSSIDRSLRLSGISTRSIDYNMEEQTETTKDSGDADIVLIKLSGDGGGKGEGNVSLTNDGTSLEGIDDFAQPEEENTTEENTEEPITKTGLNITIPILLDASFQATIYGEEEPEYDYSYNIRLQSNSFNSSLFSTLIQYVEIDDGPSGATFHFTYNEFAKDDVKLAFKNDLQNQKGTVINYKNNLQQYESGHTIEKGTLGNLIVKYFADILFNHPEAQAPIKNDTDIIKQVNVDSGLNTQFLDKVLENLLDKSTYLESTEQEKDQSKNDYLRSVLEQMFVKVPERFQSTSDGIPVSFPFKKGDQISFLIRMKGRVELDEFQTSEYFSSGDESTFLNDLVSSWNVPDGTFQEDSSLLVMKMWKFTMTFDS